MPSNRYSIPTSGALRRWGLYITAGLIFVCVWLALELLFTTDPKYLPYAVAGFVGALLIYKLYKRFRLTWHLKKLDKDPVNPERHFKVAKYSYFRNLFFTSRMDKLNALRAFRNAIQLDLSLNIRKPLHVIAEFMRRHTPRPEVARFIRLFTFYSVIEYLFDEYERKGLPVEDLFLGRSKLLQFDRRQIPHIISAYELRLRELDAFSREMEHSDFFSNPFDAGSGDISSTHRREVALLISFHHEVLGHLRRLYREYQHM